MWGNIWSWRQFKEFLATSPRRTQEKQKALRPPHKIVEGLKEEAACCRRQSLGRSPSAGVMWNMWGAAALSPATSDSALEEKEK
jgi:hypothetical protein